MVGDQAVRVGVLGENHAGTTFQEEHLRSVKLPVQRRHSEESPRPSVFPDGYQDPCSPKAIEEVLEWLATSAPVVSLGLMLRMDDANATAFRKYGPDDYRFDFQLSESIEAPLQRVRDFWNHTAGRVQYRHDVRALPGLHACLLRGSREGLKHFLDSDFATGPSSPIAGVIAGDFLVSPEVKDSLRCVQSASAKDLPRLVESFGRDCFRLGSQGAQEDIVSEIAHSDALLASALGNQFWKLLSGLFSGADPSFDPMAFLGSRDADDYLDRLGIGCLSRWGDAPGFGQTACIIDSGADESHPMMQQKIKDYVLFDCYGNYKEAYACMDHACHGTKITGQICGRTVPYSMLDVDREGEFRLGIATGSKAVVVSALGGAMRQESSTWPQFLNALAFAAHNSIPLGYEVINISLESLGPVLTATQDAIDLGLGLMRAKGLVPVFAAGNNGADSYVLGTRGIYVGALDQHGNPVRGNGRRVDFFAPGTDLVCAHPQTAGLNGTYIGRYSGSSMSAAIVTASLLIIAARGRMTAARALEVLTSTSPEGRINLDEALAALS